MRGPLASGLRPDVVAEFDLAKADASPLAASGHVRTTLDPQRWTTVLSNTDVGGVLIEATMGGARPADTHASFAESSLEGSVEAQAADVTSAIDLMHALDVFNTDLTSYQLGGATTATATLRGTVRHPIGETVAEVPHLTAREGLTGRATAKATVAREWMTLHDATATLADTAATMRGEMDFVKRSMLLDGTMTARSLDAAIRLLELPGYLMPSGPFSGTYRITGSPDRPLVDADATSDALLFAGQAPAAGSARVHWDYEGEVVTCQPCVLTRAAAEPAAARSRFEINGTWDAIRQRADATGTLTDWRIDPITWPVVAPATPTTYPLHGIASGTFDVNGIVGKLTGQAQLTMRDTVWDTIRPGTLAASMTLAHDEADVTLQAADFGLTGRAVIDQDAPYDFDATAEFAGTELATLVDRFGLDARGTTGRLVGTLAASGQLNNPESVAGSATLEAFDGTWHGLPLTLTRPSSFDWSSKEIATRTVALSLNGITLDIDGTLTTRGDARGVTAALNGRAEQIAQVLGALEIETPGMTGAVVGRLAVTGPSGAPVIDGQMTVTDGTLQWPDVPPVTGVAADLSIADGIVTVRSMTAHAEDAVAQASGTAPLRMFAEYLPDMFARRLPRAAITTASIDATLTNFTHATALAFAGERVPNVWRGGVDAHARLSADRLAVGAVDGTLEVTRATLATGELTVAQSAPAMVRITDGTATLDPWRFEGSGTDVTASGSVALGDAALPFTLALDGTLDLRLLGTFLPGRVNGTLTSAIKGTGSTKALDLRGRLTVSDANWVARDLGLAVVGLNGPLILERDRITVGDVTARVNGGLVTASGSLSTARSGAKSEILFKGSGIALDVMGVVGELSGEIRATSPGPRGLPYGVTGDVFVQPGIVRSSLRQLALTALESSTSSATSASARDLMNDIALEVRVRTLDDLVADSNELKLSATADVTITGTLAAPGAKGVLTTTDEGELFFGGRLYKVESGNIDFVDPAKIEPRLNVVANTRVAGYDVTMQILGTPTTPVMRLTSDPPLSEGDLASLLATGRTLDERSNVSEAEAKTQLLSAVSSEYLGVVGRWFGFDTVRIERDNSDLSATDLDPVARLNVTKTFGRRLEVLYSQSLAESGDNAWVITYRTGWRRLDARATILTRQSETLEVRQEVTFGGGVAPKKQLKRLDTRPRVVDITIAGLDADDERLVRKQLRLDVGERFDVFEWRRDQERVAELFRKRDQQRVTVASYRRDVGVEGQLALDYVIQPGPVTTLEVTGATLSPAAIAEMRGAWSQVGIDEFLIDEWRDIASEDLIRQGYIAARITPTITTPGNAWIRRDGHVAIEPGQRVARRDFVFEGNALVTDEQLLDIVRTERLDPAGWVRPALLSGPIREKYMALGHFDVTVEAEPVRLDGDRALLPIRIAEGRQFLVGSLEIVGEHALSETQISSALGLEAGAVYLPQVAQRGADRVADLYHREAFPDALVDIASYVDPKSASASLRLTINEGPRHVLKEVAVAGDTITSPGLFRRVANLDVNAPLPTRAVDEAQSRLYDTGIFHSVVPTIEAVGDVDASGSQPVRVTFAVEEQPRYRLRYGLQATTNALGESGFTTRDVTPGASIDLRRNNLFGRGFFAGVGASGTRRSNRVRALLGSSTWFGRNADTTFSIERLYVVRDFPSYTVDTVGLVSGVEQRWPITRNTRIAFGYSFESQTADYSGDLFTDPVSGLPLPLRIDSELGSVSTTYTWDTRDNVFNPTRGWFHSSRLEFGDGLLGSDLRYLKGYVQQYGFFSRKGIVFASAARLGVVEMNNEDLFASLAVRFRAGGATSVRGYEQDALAPTLFRDLGAKLTAGGDVLAVFNEELRIPVWRWFGSVVFVDVGNTFPRRADVALDGLLVGVGAGMRLNSPFGIIRLDYGVPVREPNARQKAIWYFGFGHAF